MTEQILVTIQFLIRFPFRLQRAYRARPELRMRARAKTSFVVCVLITSVAFCGTAGQGVAESVHGRSILIVPLRSESEDVQQFGALFATHISKLLSQAGEFQVVSWQEASSKLSAPVTSANCIIARQAAVQFGISLLVCGTYRETRTGTHVVQTSLLVMLPSRRVIDMKAVEAATVNDVAQHWMKDFREILVSSGLRTRSN